MRKPFAILGLVATAGLLAAAGQAPTVDFLASNGDISAAKPDFQPLPAALSQFDAPDLGTIIPSASSLSELVQDVRAIDVPPLDAQTRCLATSVYYESKGEPLAGQLAVAQVVLNRVENGRFGKDICAVVTAPRQFGFVRNGSFATPARNDQWQTAKAIALIAVSNSWPEVVPDATHFHATSVNPGWRLQRVATVGRHVFYR